MSIPCSCKCGFKREVPDDWAGKKVKCKCGETIVVPESNGKTAAGTKPQAKANDQSEAKKAAAVEEKKKAMAAAEARKKAEAAKKVAEEQSAKKLAAKKAAADVEARKKAAIESQRQSAAQQALDDLDELDMAEDVDDLDMAEETAPQKAKADSVKSPQSQARSKQQHKSAGQTPATKAKQEPEQTPKKKSGPIVEIQSDEGPVEKVTGFAAPLKGATGPSKHALSNQQAARGKSDMIKSIVFGAITLLTLGFFGLLFGLAYGLGKFEAPPTNVEQEAEQVKTTPAETMIVEEDPPASKSGDKKEGEEEKQDDKEDQKPED